MNYVLNAKKIVLPDRVLDASSISIEEGIITNVGEKNNGHDLVVDFSEYTVLPGLIDLHIHGGNGFDVMDGTYDALNGLSSHLGSLGITGFLATTVTSEWHRLVEAAKNIENTRKRGVQGAEIIGGYIEGPFISETHKGAHPKRFLRAISQEDLALLVKSAPSIKVVTVAPELEGATGMISYLKDRGIKTSIGHTAADYETSQEAFEAGATIAVHTFNGMRSLHHREPGIVGAALTNDEVYCELIADNIHVHPAVMDIVKRCKGTDKVCLITDCMRAGGLADGDYLLGEEVVKVKEGIARTKSGSLAGSTLNLIDAIRNVVASGASNLIEAVNMASRIPAEALGIDNVQGSIEPGKRANLTVVDDDLNVIMTILDGKVIYSKEFENDIVLD